MGSPTTWKKHTRYYQGHRRYREVEDIAKRKTKGSYTYVVTPHPRMKTVLPKPKRAPLKKKTPVKLKLQRTLFEYWSPFN